MELYIRRAGFFFPLACALIGVLVLGYGLWQSGAGFMAVGLGMLGLFGWLAWRQGKAYLRARGFRLTLKAGAFHLVHGTHEENFSADEVTQACVVRPGTFIALILQTCFRTRRHLRLTWRPSRRHSSQTASRAGFCTIFGG